MPVGMWAVMRHYGDMRTMRFACLHETEATAKEEARRLAAEVFQQYGLECFAFYVVRVTGRVGVIDGKLTDFSE